MKRLVTLLAASLMPAVALADHDEDRHHHHDGPRWNLSFSAGALFGGTLDEGESPIFEEGVDIDEAFVLEARFGIQPIDWIEIEGAVSFAPSEFVVEGDAGLFGGRGEVTLADVDIWHYTLNANFHFLPRERFDPFFILGAGAATYNVDVSNVDADTKFAAAIGGGFNVWVSETIGLRVDAKDMVTVLDVDNDYDWECDCYRDYDAESDTIHNVVVTGGLAVRWR